MERDETQWLGHKHCCWCHVDYTIGWDTYCSCAAEVTYSIMAASALASAVNRMITERCVYVIENHSGVSLACQALQRPWLGREWSVHTVVSVKAALHSGVTLSSTERMKYAMCCDNSSPRTLVRNVTQISNHHFLDIY